MAVDPRDLRARLWLGAALAEIGRFEQALAEIRRAETNPIAGLFLARVLFDAGRDQEASSALAELLAGGPNQQAQVLFGACLIRLGESEQARRNLPPSLPAAAWVLARLLLAIEERAQGPAALPVARPPAEIPGPARWFAGGFRAGMVHLRAGRCQRALAAFERARGPRAAYGAGLALYYLGHFEQARERLTPVIDNLEEPFWSDALATLGKLDLESGDAAQAVLRLRQALAAGAETEENYYALGLALLGGGRKRLARRAFERCVSVGWLGERLASVGRP